MNNDNSCNITGPLISVIVPIYKVEEYLVKCVNSIINQTYANLEIILVDDGSPDRCGELCDDLCKTDHRIKVIHKKNGGLSSARNAGINIARGEYLGFVDSDDYIEPFMYEKLLYAILNNNCSLSVCSVNYVFEDGRVITKVSNENDRVFDFYQAILEMNQYRLFDMGAWSKLYAKELFDDLRFPEGKLSEDFYIMYKIFDRAQRISYVAAPCYNYLQRKNSISRNVNINHDFEDAAKEQMEYLDEKYPEMAVIGHTAHASSALTVYDFYLKNGVACPKEKIEYFMGIVKKNTDYIAKAAHLSKSKKIQFKLFCTNLFVYNVVFLLYRKVKRV